MDLINEERREAMFILDRDIGKNTEDRNIVKT